MSVTILLPRAWSRANRVLALRFPRRKAALPPASWVGELMEQRFACLMICQPCTWKYGDALRRFGYAQHPEMKAAGVPCDFCKHTYDLVPMFFAEEKRAALSSTRAEQSELRRSAASMPPDLFGRPRRGA